MVLYASNQGVGGCTGTVLVHDEVICEGMKEEIGARGEV